MPKLPDSFKKQDFISVEKNAKKPNERIRATAMRLLQEGFDINEVAEMIAKSRNTIGNWFKRCRKLGLQGLVDKPKSGRNNKLRKEFEESFIQALIKMQDERSGGAIIGLDILQMLKDKFGVTYSLNGVYALLYRLGFSWKTGRSKHPKSDSDLQATFKKTSQKPQLA